MHYASMQDIKDLIKSPGGDRQAISIFIPTHRISLPHNLKADRVRMKNAIRDIVATLEEMKYDREAIKAHVAKLHELRDDRDFWKYRDNGLAIYATKNFVTYHDLPIEIDYSVHVSDDYIISPLLAGKADAYQYHLLDLNLKEPRYFAGSQTGLEQALVDDLPGQIETALRIDEYQEHHQHSTSPGGARDAHGHGHGGRKDNRDNDVNRYLRIIDKVMWDKVLKNSNLPLIIAADEHTAKQFEKVSSYKHIHNETLDGNHQHDDMNTLAQKSWALMSDCIEKQENLFRQILAKAKHRDSRQLLVSGEHIRKAARQGRIATLTISLIHRTYDSVIRRMEQRFKIELPSTKRQLMNIEQTAREVMKTGGEIKALLYGDNENNAANTQYVQAITRH